MKTRLLGAFVLIALLVLFVPMFFPGTPPAGSGDQAVSLAIPPAADRDLQTRTMSLNPDATAPAAAASAGAVVIPAAGGAGSDGLATVDIASHRPTDVGTDAAAPSRNPPTDEHDAAAAPSVAGEPAIAAVPPADKPATDKPTTDKAPSPTAPSTAGVATHGNFMLNLSAYASSAGAKSLMQRVRALGYPVSSHTLTQGGKSLTAVEAGPFDSRTAAESARLKITQSIQGVPVHVEGSASSSPGDDAPSKPAARPVSGSPASRPAASHASAAKAGGWAVQVAAVSSQGDANALRDKLRANGFDGFVDSVNVGGKTLWRVRAGPQSQRDDASRVRDQIKSKLGMSGNVVSVP